MNITENTVGFKLNFKTNNAIEVGVQEESGSTDEVLQATMINGGTIFINIQTKTRRARGAWR